MIVTVFASMTSTTPLFVDVVDVLSSIKTPNTKTKGLIREIRLSEDKAEIELLKKKLPWILFGGRFAKRSNNAIMKASGLIVLDIDKDFKDQNHVLEYKETLTNDNYVYSVFLSPTRNGLKVLVKIPESTDNDEYNSYFEGLKDYFEHFDVNNKGIARTCFASYDANIYINEASETWTDKSGTKEANLFQPVKNNTVTNKVKTEEISNFKEPSSWEVFNYIILPWSETELQGRGRNETGFVIASACNDYNISEDEAITYIHGELSRRGGDHLYKHTEVIASVKSAYKKQSANKKANLSWLHAKEVNNKNNTKPKKLNSTKQIQPTPSPISQEVLDIVNKKIAPKRALKQYNYWADNGKKNKFINSELLKYIGHKGYMSYKYSKNDHIFIKSDNRIIENAYIPDIAKGVTDDLLERDENAFNDLASERILFDKNFLYLGNALPEDAGLLRDKEDTVYLPFKNGIFEITSDKIKQVPYDEYKSYIWKTDIIPYDFNPSEIDEDFDIWKFLNVITPDRQSFAGLISAMGYMTSTYKDPINPKVIILNDKHSNGFESNGGSGKSLIMHMIGLVRNYCRIDGKSLDPKKDFAWQKVDIQHKVVGLDDLDKKFNFEKLFSIITDGFEVNRKYKDVIEIPYEIAPKLIISVNRRVRGTDGSTNRRRYDIDITNHFSDIYRPIDEYGKPFFNDTYWSKLDWNRFYNIMVYCVQFFLRNGLVQQDDNEQRKKIFKETYGALALKYLEDNWERGLNTHNMMVIHGIGNNVEHCNMIAHKFAGVTGLRISNSGETITFEKLERRKQTKLSEYELDNLKW